MEIHDFTVISCENQHFSKIVMKSEFYCEIECKARLALTLGVVK